MSQSGVGTTAPWRWVERWLSSPRFARYLTAAGGDRQLALDLYEWNAAVSAAILHDLAHLEVGLRNAYDQALTAADPTGDWTRPGSPLLTPLWRTHGRGKGQARARVDVNEESRRLLDQARTKAGPGAPHGKVVAELSFGFWRYLSSAAREKTLWVPHLHKAFTPGTDRRRDVDEPVTQLARLRNRAAHHEHLLTQDLAARHRDVLAVAGRIDPRLAAHLSQTAQVPQYLTTRPC